jgi:TonB family protein
MKILSAIRLEFILCLILTPIIVSGQNDTTIYFSKTLKVIDSQSNAYYYSKLIKLYEGTFALLDYALIDNKWTQATKTVIKRETDSSFTATLNEDKVTGRENLVTRRFYNKTDSGYRIRDYEDTILTQEGESKLIFPLIKYGNWRRFNTSTGEISNEGIYRNNQMVTNRWWISDSEYLTDVTAQVDKNAEYIGGDAALLKFVAEHTEYPLKAKEKHITGRVIVSFIVMYDGSIKGIKVIKKVHLLLDTEAVKVITKIPQKNWKPAEIEGKKVNEPYAIPITFSLN